jgi:hypothetical protein
MTKAAYSSMESGNDTVELAIGATGGKLTSVEDMLTCATTGLASVLSGASRTGKVWATGGGGGRPSAESKKRCSMASNRVCRRPGGCSLLEGRNALTIEAVSVEIALFSVARDIRFLSFRFGTDQEFLSSASHDRFINSEPKLIH